MALCAKALLTRGYFLSQRIVAQPMLVHVENYVYFTAKPRRQARPKNIQRKKKEEVQEVDAIQLYSKELGQEYLQSRNADLPDKTLENPYVTEKKQCLLCKYEITPDYKNVKLLSQFVSPFTGSIYGRHITGLCKEQQARIEKEIEKSRSAGLMASYIKEAEFLDDPLICNPSRPIRKHPH